MRKLVKQAALADGVLSKTSLPWRLLHQTVIQFVYAIILLFCAGLNRSSSYYFDKIQQFFSIPRVCRAVVVVDCQKQGCQQKFVCQDCNNIGAT